MRYFEKKNRRNKSVFCKFAYLWIAYLILHSSLFFKFFCLFELPNYNSLPFKKITAISNVLIIPLKLYCQWWLSWWHQVVWRVLVLSVRLSPTLDSSLIICWIIFIFTTSIWKKLSNEAIMSLLAMILFNLQKFLGCIWFLTYLVFYCYFLYRKQQ